MVDVDKIWLLLKVVVSEWRKDKIVRLGASLAFYAVFSLPPFLVMLAATAGIFYGEEAAQGRIVQEFQGLLGREDARTIQTMILQAGSPKTGIIAAMAGMTALLIGAIAVFADLQDALNTIWEVKAKPEISLIYRLKARALSLLVTLGSGFLLLVSLIVSILLSAFGDYISLLSSGSLMLGHFLRAADFLISFGIITLLFAALFRLVPDEEIAWKDVWLGASLTAWLFIIGKFLTGLYIAQSRIASVFGAAGSLATLLLWIYFQAQVFFLGAEFTRVYAKMYGSKSRPKKRRVSSRG
jgi:membrane protein